MSLSDVDVVVVSYNVKSLLVRCIASLSEAQQHGIVSRIIVIDNASHDGSAEAVETCFPNVTLIRSENVGYGGGANRGIALSSAPFILVLNPDTVVPPDTVKRLTGYLIEHPDVAVAGPRMRYTDGTIQPSRRRFPGRFTPVFESTVFDRWWPNNPWARRYRLADRPEETVQTVDWLVGACLMVRRSAIDRAGMFDEAFWMYCEEVEWCWRFRRHGWKVAYVPDAEISHHEAASTSQNIARRQLAFDRSRIELQRRMYGELFARICAAGIQASYLVQAGIELFKYAAGHRRDLRRQRIREYARLIRAGVTAHPGPVGQ